MKRKLASGCGFLALAALFVLFNLYSGRWLTDSRIDLSERKLYTLTKGTERILRHLDQPIDLYLYYSADAAREQIALRNYAKRLVELLKAYQHAANGKLRLHIIDPLPFSEDEDRATELGLQGVPLNPTGDLLYLGLAGINQAQESQAIPFFSPDQEDFLEYEISRLIQALATPQRTVVGILGNLEMGEGDSAWMVLEQVRQAFDVLSLEKDTTRIPADVSVLMLVHPRDLPESTLYAIDQFVLGGGRLLLFLDPFSESEHGIDLYDFTPDPRRSYAIAPLLKAWGIGFEADWIIADRRYAMSAGRGRGQRAIRHAAWLSLPRDAVDKNDVVTSSLESLTMSSAGWLDPLPQATTTFVPLLQSSALAMPIPISRFARLSTPEALIAEIKPTGVHYTLAARVSGPAKSAFPERQGGLAETPSLNMIVVADSDMLDDRLWVQVQTLFGQRIPQPWADNGSFVVNALDNLSGPDALISIRSRGRFSRPFSLVDGLRQEAERRHSREEERLQGQLTDTEQRLEAVQQNDTPPTPEQGQNIQQLTQEKLQLRKELREVRTRMSMAIDRLGSNLAIVNILLIPSLLLLLGLGRWLRLGRRP